MEPLHENGEAHGVAVNLSIKNVPEELAAALRARAARHHRSLQGELMAILEEAVGDEKTLSPSDVLQRVRALRLKTSDDAATHLRRDRYER